MLSPVQAIIAAEAGVNARAENIAVVIKILIRTLPENETSILLANEIRFCRPKRFQRNKFLCAAMQRSPVSRNELAIAENRYDRCSCRVTGDRSFLTKPRHQPGPFESVDIATA
jgi:hypothetical protein